MALKQEYASGGAGVAEGLVDDSLPFRAGLGVTVPALPALYFESTR